MLGDMTRAAPGQVSLGPRAARCLVTELSRRSGPTSGLLVGAAPGSEPLRAAIDALLPDDSLAVTTSDPAGMRVHLAALGGWVSERVRVVDAPDPVDVAMIADPVTGTAEEVRASLEELVKVLRPGGVLAVAAVAVPGVAPGAAAELDRQAALYGVGTDLVVRNVPPVRVHRLCREPGDPVSARELVPVDRPSSVPLTRETNIDSNGVAAVGIALGMAALAKAVRPRSRGWLLPLAAAAPVAAFFRDPRREVPDDESLVVAASDGRVLSVEHVSDDRFAVDGASARYLRVATFLSVLDVHVNRSPVAGRVADHFLEDGGYAAAMSPEAEHNVAAYTVLDTAHGRVVVAQRTGLVARRIVHRAPVGAMLARGERFGLIRFGSRTDVYLPEGAAMPLVSAGDRLVGGSTPIARWQ
jgi:phosphatidylserine decarboxylase